MSFKMIACNPNLWALQTKSNTIKKKEVTWEMR
jgi:hypothetical protein